MSIEALTSVGVDESQERVRQVTSEFLTAADSVREALKIVPELTIKGRVYHIESPQEYLAGRFEKYKEAAQQLQEAARDRQDYFGELRANRIEALATKTLEQIQIAIDILRDGDEEAFKTVRLFIPHWDELLTNAEEGYVEIRNSTT